MKANGAPEKLYLLPNGLISYRRNTDGDVEYTRTDAFIEKAAEWIMNHFSSEGFGSPLYYKGLLYRPEDIVEDFKKDMEQ